MTQFLPPTLLVLFKARDPIPYLAPVGKLPHEKEQGTYTGVGSFKETFEDPNDTPPATRVETREERRERRKKEKREETAYQLEQAIALWNPATDPQVTEDPFKTLFVARVNYETSESKLKREFEQYGPVKTIRMVQNKINGKPRGYAFVEYTHEADMLTAYRSADGKKIDSRRVLVDVERGRSMKGWLPRRLGGGLGGTRKGGADVNVRQSGRDDHAREGRERAGGDREREKERGERPRGDRRRDRSRSRDRRDRYERPDRGDRGYRMERGGDRERMGRPDRGMDRERDDRKRDRKYDNGRGDKEDRHKRRRKSRSRSREDRRKSKRYDDESRYARAPGDGNRYDDNGAPDDDAYNRGGGQYATGENGEVFHLKQEHEIKNEIIDY